MDRVREAILLTDCPYDGSGVRVAVIDTGVDPAHPDLRDRILPESESLVLTEASINDAFGHGTHICGIIAGSGGESSGRFRGVAPGADLLVLRVARGKDSRSDAVAKAIEIAIREKADIINFSAGFSGWMRGVGGPWKWPSKFGTRERAFQAAVDRGILCVASAGNEGPEEGTINSPAWLREVLAIGATSFQSGTVANSSSRGPVYVDDRLPMNSVARADKGAAPPVGDIAQPWIKPDLVAPGGDLRPNSSDDPLSGCSAEGIVSCWAARSTFDPCEELGPPHWYARMAGTSQAAAVVSGVAALVLQAARAASLPIGRDTGAFLRGVLRDSGRRLKAGGPTDWGYGCLFWPVLAAAIDDCAADHSLVAKLSAPQPQLALHVNAIDQTRRM